MAGEDKLKYQLDKVGVLNRISEHLHKVLVDCGWRNQVRSMLQNAIDESPNKYISVSDLEEKFIVPARDMVPESVMGEILDETKNIIQQIFKD